MPSKRTSDRFVFHGGLRTGKRYSYWPVDHNYRQLQFYKATEEKNAEYLLIIRSRELADKYLLN